MSGQFSESIKKRVGGSLSHLPTISRVEMLRANARLLTRQTDWKPPVDDGTLIRKTAGLIRRKDAAVEHAHQGFPPMPSKV